MIQETLGDSPPDSKNTNIKIIIVTSVLAEKMALLDGLGQPTSVDVEVVGVGSISAAIETTKLLSKQKYDLVICAGIAGGFENHTSIGDLVISDQVIAADLGAQSPEKFLSLEELELGKTRFSTTSDFVQSLKIIFQSKINQTITGTILTLSTVTGTKTTAQHLTDRYPMAVAEAMEGFGVASVADSFSVPFVEIRAISNLVGPRDKSKWRFKEAFSQLKKVGMVLKEISKETNHLQKEADK
ncbi:futalosine hydrolase [Shimazuella sp. AN120528]|uniref:futalosine hydrolase n=1 Tax=Shimazuella soli TaxID=1892854 RepID=UPI001F10CC9D|nr:futalosine hydrolase [Shimazuella soli]MCH5585721.1 futalosine hydrolase [Shimazuella soli]